MSTLSTSARNAMVDALTGLLNAGGAGALQIGTNNSGAFGTVLATCPLSATSFAAAGTPTAGQAVANAVTPDGNTVAGTAAFYRLRNNAGTTVISGTVSATVGADIVFNSVAFVAGGVCSIPSLTITEPAS